MNMDDVVKNALKWSERMNAYDERKRIAAIENKEKLDDLVTLVNDIFAEHQISERINSNQIRFHSDYIGNITEVPDKKLSHIILNHYFPKPDFPTYYYYRSLKSTLNIIEFDKIRLFNLNKRFSDGEFITFYDEHGMDGYKNGSMVFGIDCSDRAIMADIFYISLTGAGCGSLYNSLWKDFGDDGYGARLEFEILPKTEDFRQVYYSKDTDPPFKPLLKDLFSKIKSTFNKPFNFTYSSKIGAYYIKGKFQNENEYRLIIKRTSDDYNAYGLTPVVTDAANKIGYIELPFINPFVELKLISVQPGYNCSEEDIEKLNNLALKKGNSFNVLSKAVVYD